MNKRLISKKNFILKSFTSCLLILGGICLQFNSSYAVSLETLGAGPELMGLAHSSNIGISPALAAYENPATLAISDKVQVLVSYGRLGLETDPQSFTRSQAPLSSGLPLDSYSPDSAEAPQQLTLGVGIPLGTVKYLGKVGFGFSAFLPGKNLAAIHAFTGHEPVPLKWDTRSERPQIYTGLAISPWKNVQLGIGSYYTVKIKGKTQFAVSQDSADARLLMEVSPVLIPYAGLVVEWPGKSWRGKTGLVYRKNQNEVSTIDIDMNFGVGIASVPISSTAGLAAYYDPEVWELGQSLEKGEWVVVGKIKYENWNKFAAPIINLKGKDIDSLTEGPKGQKINLQNVWYTGLGLEKQSFLSAKNTLRVGLGYETSSVKKNPEEISILDTDKYLLGLGLSRSFHVFLNKPGAHLKLHGAYLISILEDRDYSVRNSQGVVSTAHVGGYLHAINLGVSYDF